MRAAGHAYDLLSDGEVQTIHAAALRILGEVGMEIQNDELLQALGEVGALIDGASQRARFPGRLVEDFLATAPKMKGERSSGGVGGSAGVYHGRFHDPRSGELVAWDETNLPFYFSLASKMDFVHGASMLGSRLPGAQGSGKLEPLYERYLCWKYGAEEGGSIYEDDLCPYLYDLYQLRAEQLGKPLREVFRGNAYLIPALKLGRHEAYQVAWFRRRGLRVPLGDMLGMGGTSPVTLAGTVTLNLAEQLALRILEWALYGEKSLRIGGSMSPIDMRTMIYPYGRPEMALANLMTAQLARFYGASYSGHAGLSDAKLPSVEAGYQKALSAIPTLLACGSLWMDAGLLSIDEVCSPVQLILDEEFLSALSRFTTEFEISDESIGLEDILALGPGGSYLDRVHTARFVRKEQWQPRIWSREMLAPWLNGPRQTDIERAREQAAQAYASFRPVSQLSPEHEREILAVVQHAGKELAC